MTLDLSPVDRASLALSYGDYLRFSQLMQDRSGLAFPEKRRTELEIGVRRAFAASTCPDLDSYYRFLQDGTNGLEMERLINYLTIGESHFFRDEGQFDALLTAVLPELIERHRATRTLRIWSAGCASGEEPYSIAMLLLDLLPDLSEWNITLLGTDINTQHLERARKGVYSQWAFRENRAKLAQARYFTPQGSQYVLAPAVRQMVHFEHLNLSEDDYPSYETNTMFMDLILCRNVTIYFPESVTRQVVNRFYQALSDGGWLVIGHSEHSLETYHQFETHNFPAAILYKRGSQAGGEPAHAAPGSLPQVFLPAAPFHAPAPTGREAHLPPLPVSSSSSLQHIFHHSAHEQMPTQPAEGSTLEQAQEQLNMGKMDRARDLLLRFLSAHPADAAASALLGKTYANMGNWPEAERWCQLAVAHNRLNLDAYYTLALVYQHQGRRDEAIEMMKKVVYIDRNDILGHFGLADMYAGSGQKPAAVKYLENARKLLEIRAPGDLVPRSGDITVERLYQTVVELQQTWGG